MHSTRLSQLISYRLEIAAFVLLLLTSPAPTLYAAKTTSSPEGLARVRQTGTFRVGYYSDAGPFSYQDQNGKPAGFAVELCAAVVNDLRTELGLPSLNVEYVLVTGEDRFDAVTQGRVDLLCGPSVETIARRQQVSFSLPIFPGGLGALLRSDAPAQVRDVLLGHEPPYRPLWRASISQALQHRTFAAVSGTTSLNWLSAKVSDFKLDARIVPVENHDAGVQAVFSRRSDVLFGERSILLDAKKRNPSGKDLIVLDRLFTYEPFAFALARTDEDLRLFVDKSISQLSRSGETQKLYRRYFGEPDEITLTFFRINTISD